MAVLPKDPPTARERRAARGFRAVGPGEAGAPPGPGATRAAIDSRPEACESGRIGTTGNRVALQGAQGFKSLRLRWRCRGEGCRPRVILAPAVLGGGLGVPCTGNPRYAGLNYSPAACVRPGSTRCAALMVGSRATRSREPGQARKGAAVSGVPGVPRVSPAGARSRERVGRSWVQGEVHGRFSRTSSCTPRN